MSKACQKTRPWHSSAHRAGTSDHGYLHSVPPIQPCNTPEFIKSSLFTQQFNAYQVDGRPLPENTNFPVYVQALNTLPATLPRIRIHL